MKVATPKQMNEIDRLTINKIGVPGIVLMENAAVRIFDKIADYTGGIAARKFFVLAGKGNNGGDAFAVSRHLHNNGARVEIYIICEREQISGDAAINLGIIESMGIRTVWIPENKPLPQISESIKNADFILDGLFGTGFRGKMTGRAAEITELVNSSGKPVISIDIPSGVNGATGGIEGACIKASVTVTLALPKTGIIINPGCEQTGELIVADIGIPPEIINGLGIRTNTIEKEYVTGVIPSRKVNSNKGDFGKVFIITGSKGMTGAGCLSGRASLRSGAGLVYLGVPESLVPIYDTALTESVTIPLEDKGRGSLSRDCISQVLNQLNRSTVAAVGPGLSLDQEIIEVVSSIIENAEIPLVLDADALNAVSKDVTVLGKLKTQAIITPHPGEMAKLAGISIEDVQNNRIDTALSFASKWNVITVLKGSRTVVAFPDGSTYINLTGNSGMATGGTGDVLTGLVAGLIGQGVKPEDAAVAGVYIHGLAGDRAAALKGEHGLIAGDLVDELPYTIKQLTIR